MYRCLWQIERGYKREQSSTCTFRRYKYADDEEKTRWPKPARGRSYTYTSTHHLHIPTHTHTRTPDLTGRRTSTTHPRHGTPRHDTTTATVPLTPRANRRRKPCTRPGESRIHTGNSKPAHASSQWKRSSHGHAYIRSQRCVNVATPTRHTNNKHNFAGRPPA
jgi:hypothetical protein